MSARSNNHSRGQRAAARRRGAAAILSMMFLVIFGSLAAAMAIVAQGNLATADSHLKIGRSLATAETGMNFMIYRLNLVAATIKTRDGIVDSNNAPALWNQTRAALLTSLSNEFHSLSEPYQSGNVLHVGPISLGAGNPTFSATFTPHPLAGENYNSAYYQRPPYSQMNPPVSSAAPLDATWIRVRVQATDGTNGHEITRAIQMDFKLDKKIPYAILSRSRVMIGPNVLIQGAVGSEFMETNLANGHPVQMVSDFRGLAPDLDTQLDALKATLVTNDTNGDNRIDLFNPTEAAGISNPGQYDTNGDGFIDEFDFFLSYFDPTDTGRVTVADLTGRGVNSTRAQELVTLISQSLDPANPEYNDGMIHADANYAKIRGEVLISADKNGWQNGAAGGMYQTYFQGPIQPDYEKSPLTFQASANNAYTFGADDFDVSTFRNMATGDLATQAAQQAALYNPADPNSPQPLGTTSHEAAPYGAAHPYDYYDRPIYKNMTFTNVAIPQGNNALFQNCTFVGCTFVETSTNNTDPNYNYAGGQEADGSQKYPGLATADGNANTKTTSNNLRFDSCTFEGSIVTDAPTEFTHIRNKLAFTGATRFNISNSTHLTATEKALYERSTIIAPQYSIDMGTFVSPDSSTETVQLSGTIVAGLIDMRGQVQVTGSILTTFQPQSNTGPVLGQTSPQFNTTLGYFGSADGDLEAELPATGLGIMRIKYDPTLALPDGILGPIQITANKVSYSEVGG